MAEHGPRILPTPTFLTLPSELRLQIYFEVFTDSKFRVPSSNQHQNRVISSKNSNTNSFSSAAKPTLKQDDRYRDGRTRILHLELDSINEEAMATAPMA